MRSKSIGLSPIILLSLCVACTNEGKDSLDTGTLENSTEDTATEDSNDTNTSDSNDTSDTDTTDTNTFDPTADIVPLYNSSTELEPENHFDNGTAVITRFSDRGRDRHAREDQFQSYDHYLSHYWTHRTARFRFEDTVAHGGSTIEISMVSEWRLSIPEFRAWYSGLGTVASYHGNYANSFIESGPGTFDIDHEQISDDGTQYRYTFTLDHAFTVDGGYQALAVGQTMEFEASQFLMNVPEGRANYYGTTFLYEVGTGGLVPWNTDLSARENSIPIDEAGWLGGRTTIPYDHSGEPDNAFMQMATNLSGDNGQAFVEGRRVHHTDMLDGSHDESPQNGIYGELVGLAGPLYSVSSCDGCHKRNGRGALSEVGEALNTWVVKVGDENGRPLPNMGSVMQPLSNTGAGEGTVSIAEWIENGDGLRHPALEFSMEEPPLYSARIAPQIVGIGLLEAIDEADILAWEDPTDNDNNGISGVANRIPDPETGETRLGRLGWKASTISVAHQTASALNGDMGVMTSMLPTPDCGSEQDDCGNDAGAELSDERLDSLVRYVSLLGVRARRDLTNDTALEGELLFEQIGCADCHRPTFTTSPHHPLAELRSQTIHPYTDLLLHDMGEGLADGLGEFAASGSEWRTPPLWSIGLGACVTGGVEGPNQNQTCTPDEHYLHDGRARTLDEAIHWHGGEGQGSKDAYLSLTESQKSSVIQFLQSL